MITLAPGLRVCLACGVTNTRKGMTGLAMLVPQGLSAKPFDGAVFAFRGRCAGLIELLRRSSSPCADRSHSPTRGCRHPAADAN